MGVIWEKGHMASDYLILRRMEDDEEGDEYENEGEGEVRDRKTRRIETINQYQD